MNQHYTYLLILGLSIAGPLTLSFDNKVGFYKKWKQLCLGMILPAVFFIIWDIIFTKKNVWSFNSDFILGYKLSVLPLEEILFFFVVPYCCIFIYECIKCYFPALQNERVSKIIFCALGAALLFASFFWHDRAYTFWTFIFTAILIFCVCGIKSIATVNITVFLISYLIILLPFLAVNGILTSLPVIIYNNSQNLGIRVLSIPFEDVFYGMLLFLMNAVIYERLLLMRT